MTKKLKKITKKDYKENCGFRKYLRICHFDVEHCQPPKDGDDYGDCCHLYPLEWDAKYLKNHAKSMTQDMLNLEKKLKEFKKNDKKKYKETKRVIKDYFEGLIMIDKAYKFIKRSGGAFKKKKLTKADKIKKKLIKHDKKREDSLD